MLLGCRGGIPKILGVVATTVGFMGGTIAHPSYEQVCAGDTKHVEVCQVQFDPQRISYEQLLDVFWNIHDPTQENQQGPDIGSQYRSVIFTHTPEQERTAQASKERLEASGDFVRPIVTTIEPATTFFRAEEKHQRYHEKHGGGTC